MTVKPIFAWYDMWIGAFWDANKRRLYVFPVPCLGVVIQFKHPNAAAEAAMAAGPEHDAQRGEG